MHKFILTVSRIVGIHFNYPIAMMMIMWWLMFQVVLMVVVVVVVVWTRCTLIVGATTRGVESIGGLQSKHCRHIQ